MQRKGLSKVVWRAVACSFVLFGVAPFANALPLEGRLPSTPGGSDYQAYYDPNLDITWAANPTLGGLIDWATANSWASSLTIDGIGGWRLPSSDVNGDGTVINCSGGGVPGCEDNEMGYLYWEEGITSSTPAPFGSVPASPFWSGTDLGSTTSALGLDFSSGSVFSASKTFSRYAWAVQSGDVALIPEPSTFVLVASGIVALAVRQRNARS